MFDVHCTACDRRVLRDIADIKAVNNIAPGVILLTFRCPAGHSIRLVTGRRAEAPTPAARH